MLFKWMQKIAFISLYQTLFSKGLMFYNRCFESSTHKIDSIALHVFLKRKKQLMHYNVTYYFAFFELN